MTARRRLAAVKPQPCTGIAASWCPNHGDCTCGPVGLPGDHSERADIADERTLDDWDCPLHAPDSPHAEPPTQTETLF